MTSTTRSSGSGRVGVDDRHATEGLEPQVGGGSPGPLEGAIAELHQPGFGPGEPERPHAADEHGELPTGEAREGEDVAQDEDADHRLAQLVGERHLPGGRPG